ncbi:hypothetical protein RhiirA4_486950 [Rhizophagus irregularis]|uniref:Uncharacterized protein n=1 Tax=Rhizophagus irregularis TaxID=588596 RepID=A0A2I1HS21_9GLOM|nr:hypothetical protein RhiirA4_486950 [Rhizophagus irregularis]
MEGVEFTSSQLSGSNNASSLNQAVAQQPENNNGQGLCFSVHTLSHKENEPTVSTALDKSDKQPQQSIKVIKATYDLEELAQKVLERQIIEGNKVRFCKIEGINQAQDNQQSYEIRIWNVLLDIEKNIFEQHLRSIGNVKSIKFNIKQLYYEVAVTFADNKLEERFKKECVIRFCKHVFRVFPSTLSREERNHRFKYVLKLANLPSGTCAIDLAEIADITKAKAIFLPKNKFSRNYEKEPQRTHSVYQSIYKRYQVKAPTAKGGFNPLFPKQRYEEPTNYWEDGLDNWEDKQNGYANIAKMNSNQGSSNSNNPQSAAKQQQARERRSPDSQFKGAE